MDIDNGAANESPSSVDVVELQKLKNRVMEIREQIRELIGELTAKERHLREMGRAFIQELGLNDYSASAKPRGTTAGKSKATRRKGDKKKDAVAK